MSHWLHSPIGTYRQGVKSLVLLLRYCHTCGKGTSRTLQVCVSFDGFWKPMLTRQTPSAPKVSLYVYVCVCVCARERVCALSAALPMLARLLTHNVSHHRCRRQSIVAEYTYVFLTTDIQHFYRVVIG